MDDETNVANQTAVNQTAVNQIAETQEEKDERRRHGSSFGDAAAAYAEHRPDYADAAIRWALEPVWSRQPLRVVDLGAGTGKLTAALVRLGTEVTAVEPDEQMLAELRQQMPSVRSVAGRAEEIPLPDGSVDAVLAAQSMHWFEMDLAMPEIARVLTPGGVLAGLWNVDDDRVGWVAEFAEMSKRKASVTLLRWRDTGGQSREMRFLKAGSELFQPGETNEFEHGQPRTADSLLATVATHSHLLTMDEPERLALLARLRDFLQARPETSSGDFVLPMITVALRILRK